MENEQNNVQLVKLEDVNKTSLTAQQKQEVEAYKKQVDINDSLSISKFGNESQKGIADFSTSIINGSLVKDSGEVGGLLTDLSLNLKGFNEDLEEKKGIMKLFENSKKKVATLKTKYSSLEQVIRGIEQKLITHQKTMQDDVKKFDQLYTQNEELFKKVSLYIIAGEEKLEELKTVDLPALQQKANETGDELDAQKVKDLTDGINRFEKKIYDLKLTKTISIQNAPSIRMLQSNDLQLSDKISNSIFTTIPLWKQQFAIALGLNNAKQALEAQQAVTDITNELLKRNSELLKTSTIEIAKEFERGMVDIETLRQVNDNLIQTVDSVIEIHKQGEEARKQGEQEMTSMVNELITRMKGEQN